MIRYEKNNDDKEVIFLFEVFSIKLDYKTDYKKIIESINKEYPNLVLSYLRSTFINFKNENLNKNEIIWWRIFEKIYDELIKTFKYILERPHYKIIKDERYVVADKIKRWTSKLEEEFTMFKHLPARRYKTLHYFLSLDTFENRFLKFVIKDSKNKFKRIKEFLENNYELTEEYKNNLNNKDKELKKIMNNPFFRIIGEFKGFRQESLVLEKATGYSKLFKLWLLLKSSYTLFENNFDVSLKNIAELYQIWCFLKIKKIIEEILNPQNIEVDIKNIFRKDNTEECEIKAKIKYKASNIEIDLMHEYEYSIKTTPQKSYTIKQRPDIVLQITKNNIIKYTFTYLFDAKYRVDIDNNNNETPPEDAINQMHRYRDAIYYERKISGKNKIPEKEVIGAYVLFPSKLPKDEYEKEIFWESIKRINIGAIPLSPTENNIDILKDFLKRILQKKDYEILEKEVIPQKNMQYESVNSIVLIGFVPDDDHLKWIYEKGFYFTGEKKPTRFGFDKLKYFAPYIKGKGIKEFFKIVSYEIKKRNEIFKRGEDKTERLILYLTDKQIISEDYLKIKDSIKQSIYRYTFLIDLKNPEEGKIKTYSKDEMIKKLKSLNLNFK